MMRPAAASAAGLALAVALAGPAAAASVTAASGTASSGTASSETAALATAVKALLAGKHVYASPGAPAIHQAALTTSIGSHPIWVVARKSSGTAASDWLAQIAIGVRSNGTYVLLEGNTLVATSNTLPPAGIEAVRAAAVKDHPKDAVAALDEFVQKLASGAADTAPATAVSTATATPATSGSASPLLLLLLIPILGGVAFAVTRARRRTG